jgi:hypothetical protein
MNTNFQFNLRCDVLLFDVSSVKPTVLGLDLGGDIKMRLSLGNACYHLARTFCLLSKDVNI